jgi:phage shock protein PspC (stress-responsive transcriptional regulator)
VADSENRALGFRRVDDAPLAGICSALAEKYGFNVGGVRFCFIVLQFSFMPYLFFLYLLAWVLFPKGEPEEEPEDILNRVEKEFESLKENMSEIEDHLVSKDMDDRGLFRRQGL